MSVVPRRPDQTTCALWGWLAAHPRAVLALLCALLVLPTLGTRDYWAFDEVRHADVLDGVLNDGRWLSLELNGHPYPDKPPLYFWYTAIFAGLLGHGGLDAFVLASGLAGLLLLLGTRRLAQQTLGLPTGTALLAALVLMTMPLFQILLRTTRMDLLFSAAILLAHLWLLRGLQQDQPNRWVVFGFLVSGIAALIKGPLGIGFPVVTVLAWSLWRGRGARLLRRDVLGGILASLALIAGWAASIVLIDGQAYFATLVDDQLIGRALAARKHAHPAWFYLAGLLPMMAPWFGLLQEAPWSRIIRGRPLLEAARRRKEGDGSRAFLWTWFLAGLLLLSAADSKLVIYLMPLLPPVAVLFADFMSRLDGVRARRIALVGGLLFVLAGIALVVASGRIEVPGVDDLPLFALGLPLLLTGAMLLILRMRSRVTLAATVVGGMTAASLVAVLVLVPRLDPIMSPRDQARVIAREVDAGREALVFRTYGGTYTHYAGQDLTEVGDEASLASFVAKTGPLLLTTARKHFEAHAALLADFRVIHEQRVEGKLHLVAIRDALATMPGDE